MFKAYCADTVNRLHMGLWILFTIILYYVIYRSIIERKLEVDRLPFVTPDSEFKDLLYRVIMYKVEFY